MTEISPNDAVPALRHHLVFSESPQGLGDGLLSVTNINSGEELRLRGFEYSLARMLDGHRTAREVVDAAEKLGLPLTLGGLEGFVNKLASFDLVGAGPDEDDGLSPFNPRVRWDESTREKYREALREGRTGHLDEATHALDDLLERSPETVEARRLRDRVEQRQQSPVSFPSVFHETERNWLVSARAAEVSPIWIHGRGVMLFWVLIVMTAALILGAALVPIPRVVSAPAILLPISSSQVVAPRSGTLVNVPVVVGQSVKKGDLLFAYDVTATLAALDLAIVRIERQQVEVERAAAAAVRTAGDEERARYQQAEARVTRAEDLLTRARQAAGDPFSEAVLEQEDAFGDALEGLHEAQVALDARDPQRQLATLHRLEAEVMHLERELEQSEVRAPEAGRVIALAVHAGDSVQRGLDAVRLDDNRQLRVVATIAGASTTGIEAGQPAELTGQGQRIATTVRRIEGPYVELVIDNAAMAFQPGIARVEIHARPRPFVQLR